MPTRTTAVLTWLTTACALLAGCEGSGGQRSATAAPSTEQTPTAATTVAERSATCAPALPHALGDVRESIASGGMTRTFILHVPAGYDGAKRTPVVLLFHGFNLSAEFMEQNTGIVDTAEANGFIAVILDGQGTPPIWNTGVPGATDDVLFVRDVLDRVEGEVCVNAARVYAAGYSNGGGMSQLLSCELSDRIAAVAVVASTRLNCAPQTPVVAFHGDADPVQPFGGGAGIDVGAQAGVGGTLSPVRDWIAGWAATLGCDTAPAISRPAPDVELSTFGRCSGRGEDVLLYVVIGGGHNWPGGTVPFGPPTSMIDATSLMWDFFAAHPG